MIHEDVTISGSFQTSGSFQLPKHSTSGSALAVTGSMYHDTTDNRVKLYTGTEWITLTGSAAAASLNTDIEYLLVAGGGGGGGAFNTDACGGGAGAGGLLSSSLASVASGSSFTITVGGGGTGAPGTPSSTSPNGDNGTDSSIAGATITTITATGGGGGSTYQQQVGSDGGSGAGAGGAGGYVVQGGSGTVGQGNDGGDCTGTGQSNGSTSSGGGGGAGGAGANGTANTTGGAGGDGLTSSITGTSTTYAGGGGGGSSKGTAAAGGSGGGGNAGAASSAGSAGTANTGGGGGGAANGQGAGNGSGQYAGGTGGSGVAIFAYDSGSFNCAGGIVGDVGNGRKYHQFNASDTFKVGSTSDFQIVTTNLVSHFDAGHFSSRGASTWTDLSGNGHDISGNSITLGANFYNDFNGSTSYYSKSDTAHNFADNNFTVEIWAKWDSLSNGDTIASKRGTGNPGTRDWLFGHDSAGLVYFLQYHDSSNYTYPQTNSGTVTTGTWYHLVATGDSSNLKVYVNTTEEASASFVASGIQSTSAPLQIGRRGTNSGHQYFDGQIAQFRAYSSALTAAQITQNYNATKTNFV